MKDKMNILAFGSHPDDVEFMCGGTLLKYKQDGHRIFIALTTSGNIGSNVIEGREKIAGIREGEQLEAAKAFDADVRFLRYDDEGLMDTPQVRRDIINTIRWANPDVIFTNPPCDMSTDHNMTGTLIGRVVLSLPGKNVPADEPPIQKAPSIFYWDTAAGVGFNPEVYVDISEVYETKIEALSKHKSQSAWMDEFQPGGFLDHCRILSEFRGLQTGCRYAEAFQALRIHGFMADFGLLPFAN
jgi:N-acetylglucosamine malate deacetylase 1